MIPRRTGGAARVANLVLQHAGSRPAPRCVCGDAFALHAQPHGRCWRGHPEAPPEYTIREARTYLAGQPAGPCACTRYNPHVPA